MDTYKENYEQCIIPMPIQRSSSPLAGLSVSQHSVILSFCSIGKSASFHSDCPVGEVSKLFPNFSLQRFSIGKWVRQGRERLKKFETTRGRRVLTHTRSLRNRCSASDKPVLSNPVQT